MSKTNFQKMLHSKIVYYFARCIYYKERYTSLELICVVNLLTSFFIAILWGLAALANVFPFYAFCVLIFPLTFIFNVHNLLSGSYILGMSISEKESDVTRFFFASILPALFNLGGIIGLARGILFTLQ